VQFVLLGGFPVSHSVSAATDPAFMASGATPFLRWKVFEALSAMGYAATTSPTPRSTPSRTSRASSGATSRCA
jgi:hypothetical protein